MEPFLIAPEQAPPPIPYCPRTVKWNMWGRKNPIVMFDHASFQVAANGMIDDCYGQPCPIVYDHNTVRPKMGTMAVVMLHFITRRPMLASDSAYGLVNPRIVDTYVTMPMLGREGIYGLVGFTADVMLPALVDTSKKLIWMSYTPSEVVSQARAVEKARGHVMIGGLGMAWFARTIARRPSVTKVTVVEQCPEVIALFGEKMREDFGERVEIVQGDAYLEASAACLNEKYNAVLMDIWPQSGDSVLDMRWQKIRSTLRRRGVLAWGW